LDSLQLSSPGLGTLLPRAMSKRNPTSELNHENWDQEDEKEDAGRFKTASQDVLKGREIRVAKRRAHDSEGKGTGGLFKSFTGFTGFGAQAASATTAPSLAFNFSANATAATTTDSLAASSTTTTAKSATPAADPNAAHLAQLKALNQSVLRWIQSHPLLRCSRPCSATTSATWPTSRAPAPVRGVVGNCKFVDWNGGGCGGDSDDDFNNAGSAFEGVDKSGKVQLLRRDYVHRGIGTDDAATTATTMTPAMPATFSFNSQQPQKPATDGAATTATFFFGAQRRLRRLQQRQRRRRRGNVNDWLDDSVEWVHRIQIQLRAGGGAAATATWWPVPVRAGGFAAASAAAASSSQEEQEDEEYEPPKPETREIREDGAVFSQKCKLFYMAAGEANSGRRRASAACTSSRRRRRAAAGRS
uniref:NUP50 domain-containing protein n=1 Tax=Macrostomum lignano TaxID=282301 RepID=A0A1I8FR74_9PLAT